MIFSLLIFFSDKLLGSGAFGMVYRAKAKGILNTTGTTIVAIKTIKSKSIPQQLKALESEIKIMLHIGRHINIVNILGACTTGMVKKGE